MRLMARVVTLSRLAASSRVSPSAWADATKFRLRSALRVRRAILGYISSRQADNGHSRHDGSTEQPVSAYESRFGPLKNVIKSPPNPRPRVVWTGLVLCLVAPS